MNFFGHGISQGWHLLISGDPYLWHLVLVTLEVTTVSTIAGLIIGLPIGLMLGLGRFRGRGAVAVLANAGLALPPVLVGLVLSLLMFPRSPLGRFHLLFTLRGVYLAQSLLAIPIIVALTAAAIRALPDGLLDQARGFGASRAQLCTLAMREARVGVMAAVIVAASSSLSEVGAVVLVGGNIQGTDQTLASAALQQIDAGNFSDGVAIGVVLLVLIILVTGTLTVLQRRTPQT